MTPAAALAGVGVGAGALLVLLAVRGEIGGVRRPALVVPWPRVGVALGIAGLVGVVTRWPVAALLSAAAAWAAPGLLGGRASRLDDVARTEAVAGWAEMMRDTLAGAAGLEQAIVATAAVAPAPIRAAVMVLASELRAGSRLRPALARFAITAGDPTADLVVAALLLAAERRGAELGALLGALADAAREQASAALRTDASRARTRTSVRVVSITTVVVAVVLAVADRSYLAPYGSAAGQVVLTLVGGCFGLALWWLARMGRVGAAPRLLVPADLALQDHAP